MAIGSVLVLGAGAGASAVPASAATFCVHQPDGCAGTPAATIQAALDLAAVAPGRDRVEVGWHTGDGAEGFTIAAGNAVDVVGVGSRPSIELGGAATVRVEEPTAVIDHIDFFVGTTTAGPPIDLVAGTLQHSNVWMTALDPTIRIADATLRDVHEPFGTEVGTGVQAVGPGGLIEDSQLQGLVGVASTSGALAIRRTLIDGTGLDTGSVGLSVTAGTTTVDDSTIRVGATQPGGVAVGVAPASPGGSAALALRGVTVEGDRESARASTGVRAACAGAASATVSLLDTVAWSSGLDLEQSGSGCAVALDHVRYGARAGAFSDGPSVAAGPTGPMAYLTAGAGSPLIDAGSTRAVTGGDVLRQPRVVDGDGDGIAVRDIGAGEYQRQAPVAAIELERSSIVAGQTLVASAGGSSDPDDEGEQLRYAWSVDGVPVPAAEDGDPSLEHVIGAVGAHVVRVVVTDPAGLSAEASATATVVAPEVWLPPVAPPSNPADSYAPVVSGPPVVGDAPAEVKAVLLGRRPSRGRLRVGVTCLQTGPVCRARIVLRVPSGRGTVTLGRSKLVGVPSSATRVVDVPLSAAGRALLRRHPKGVVVRVAVLKSSGRSWTNGEGGRVRP